MAARFLSPLIYRAALTVGIRKVTQHLYYYNVMGKQAHGQCI